MSIKMIYKIKNPVEFSFHILVSNYPDSGHWADKERFYSFVKTVCRYNAKKWKAPSYLKKRILERLPHFDPERLDFLLDLYIQLIDFYKTIPLRSTGIAERKSSVNSSHYIEKEVKDGKIYERILPIDI